MNDCYFYIESPDTDNATIRAMCIECYKKHKENILAFWNGERGYGINDIVRCAFCDKIIYEKNQTPV